MIYDSMSAFSCVARADYNMNSFQRICGIPNTVIVTSALNFSTTLQDSRIIDAMVLRVHTRIPIDSRNVVVVYRMYTQIL